MMTNGEFDSHSVDISLGPYRREDLVGGKPARAYVDVSCRPAYVLIDGPKIYLDLMISLLRVDGIEPLRHGPSRRVADDGHFYDWWIRIPHDERAIQLKQELAAVASDAVPQGKASSTHDADGNSSLAHDSLGAGWAALLDAPLLPAEDTLLQEQPTISESERGMIEKLDRLKHSHDGFQAVMQKQLADLQENVRRLTEQLSEPTNESGFLSRICG